jgi:hypothetical protein
MRCFLHIAKPTKRQNSVIITQQREQITYVPNGRGIFIWQRDGMSESHIPEIQMV